MKLSSDKIEEAIRNIKELDSVDIPKNNAFYIPATIRGDIDRNKYKGIGRPRDKDYIRIDTREILKGIIK